MTSYYFHCSISTHKDRYTTEANVHIAICLAVPAANTVNQCSVLLISATATAAANYRTRTDCNVFLLNTRQPQISQSHLRASIRLWDYIAGDP